MKKIIKLTIATTGLILFLLIFNTLKSKNNIKKSKNNIKPNIVLILADDLAYGDLGCYGNNDVKTPNLDKLARSGVLFTDFHSNGSVCSPTRAAMLSGRYQHRVGVPNVSSTSVLHSDEVLISSRLRDEMGYATGLFGKWHLSGHYNTPEYYKDKGPVKFGFDEFRGCMDGMIDYVNHITPLGRPDWWFNDQLIEEEGYVTHLITNHAIQFIEKKKNQPFFAFVSYTAIHFPWMTPENEAHYKLGVDQSRAGNPENSKIGPYDGKPELQGAVHKMIEDMDEQIGRIIATLHELGLVENTLIFFTSDNGGYVTYDRGNDPIERAPGAHIDSFQERNMGRISNLGGLRGQKHQLYEGGHRVPAIASMPGVIPSGSVCEKTAITFDLFPTLLEIAGIDPATNPKPIDGSSMWPLFTGTGEWPDRTLFWEWDGNKAMRQNEWKLVRRKGLPSELYNLNKDMGETQNLASEYPKIIASMEKALADWVVDVGIE